MNAGTARNPEDKRGAGGESTALSGGEPQMSDAEARWQRIHQNDVEVRWFAVVAAHRTFDAPTGL